MAEKNFLGNDLFTDINLLNIEMKALHTPRELGKEKCRNFDFSEYHILNSKKGNKNEEKISSRSIYNRGNDVKIYKKVTIKKLRCKFVEEKYVRYHK